MVRERFSRHLLRYAVEDYGSQTHLARALGITRDQLRAWMSGEEEIPSWAFQAVADLLQARKKPLE